ncbi:MAG TPA: acetyl-CoA carboxylase biotin carboxyl carrier protein [Anaeromyxobacter sp.]|nr:acetyl-CoA carboxylase biotin carboxyl carrier protein [Anaeromyxobacter sp.]
MASRPPKQPAERTTAGPGAGFSLEDVRKLVQLVEESDVTRLAWKRGGDEVVVERGSRGAPAVAAPAHSAALAVTASVPPLAAAAAPAAKGTERPDQPGVLVSSPFVGTFYRSPSPDAPPFVDIGHKVKKGQTLCIIEAMKLMNEIESEVDGTVAEILVPNATAVEFGEALFRIVPG